MRSAAARLGWSAKLAVPLVAALGLIAGLTGCADSKEFDSEAYCEAITNPALTFDAKALIDGDEETLTKATDFYIEIGSQAPEHLKPNWDVLVTNLGSMLQVARGELDVSDVDYEAFSDAFDTIEQDKHQRCQD
ncbi:MAG: hypothetical protein LBJ62_00445 [Bifidobacteriaceae bacterium]|jgi:hypothetical protein|nr:hypothetical protein [Bifidobacteriaceae bacterium]